MDIEGGDRLTFDFDKGDVEAEYDRFTAMLREATGDTQ